MRTSAVVNTAVLTLACVVATARPLVGQSGHRLVLTGATVIDATGSAPRADVDIVVDSGRITAIVDTRDRRTEAAEIVDCAGKFVVPGLADMHVHLQPYALPLLVANGVTAVRDMGGDLVALDWIRRSIESGRLVGPTVFRVGPFVDGGKPGLRNRLLVTTKEEGADAARLLAKLGVDAIKVHSGVPREAYFALLAEARKLNVPVVGHAPVALTALEISNAGQQTIEHMSSIAGGRLNALIAGGMNGQQAFAVVEGESAALYRAFVRNGTWVDPTFVAEYVAARRAEIAATPDRRRDAVAASVRRSWEQTWPAPPASAAEVARNTKYFDTQLRWAGAMRAAGVRFLAGTDLGVRDIFPGSSLHDELEWLVKAGFTPLEALQTATLNPAIALGRQRTMGTIAVGMSADLAVLDANPLENINNLRKIRGVMLRGRWLNRQALDRLIADAVALAPTT
jgi:imidazolonepropionase-like amidohydrolase